MRVKLSYTVDHKRVLRECAKILNLSADDMQKAISLFNEVQGELKEDDEVEVNTNKSLEMISEFREMLLNIDTRLSEISEIIVGLEEWRLAGRFGSDSTAPDQSEAVAPKVETVETEVVE